MIEQSFQVMGNARSSVMGDALHNFLSHHDEDPEDIVFDADTDRKIRQLIEYDKVGDLAWMRFESWHLLSERFRRAFEESIDPLFLGCIYFSHAQFRNSLPELGRFLASDHVIYALSSNLTSLEYVVQDANPKSGLKRSTEARFLAQAARVRRLARFVVFRVKRRAVMNEVTREEEAKRKEE